MPQKEVPQMMRIYVFSSNNLTNIWAGVGAGRWAVSLKLADNKGTVTKARKIKIGSLGILYCSQTHEFTTPFLFKSIPREETVTDIWPERWGLPFEITPLGSPLKRLSKDKLKADLPSVVGSKKLWNQVLKVQPTFSFQPMQISFDDWAYLYNALRL